MPTYDGIGSSITHRVEVVGDSLFQDVDGGTLSTKVPVQIFSNYYASPGSVDSSRQLRFRVQPDGESNVSNSYVTDMGVKGADGSNYFFITAPQNTSNVGDQNTFVISTTSNVGIGTTDPVTTLQVVGDIKCQTLTASNIVGGSPLTISADSISINAPVTMPADAPMEIGTMTVSNIFHSDQLTMSAHVAMGSDKTLTTSNIVANTGDNLSLNSKLFVDTTTGRVGIGVVSPSAKLDVFENSTNPICRLSSGDAVLYTFAVNTTYGRETMALQTTIDNGGIGDYSQGEERYVIALQPYKGRIGIGVTNPTQKLDVNGYIKQTNTWFFVSDTRTAFTSYFNFGNSAITTYGSHWNASNQRFTAPVTGLYIFTFNGFTVNEQHFGIGYNSTYPDTGTYGGKQLWAINGGTGGSTSWFLKLNVNDFITLTLYNTGNLNGGRCYFMGGLIYAV